MALSRGRYLALKEAAMADGLLQARKDGDNLMGQPQVHTDDNKFIDFGSGDNLMAYLRMRVQSTENGQK